MEKLYRQIRVPRQVTFTGVDVRCLEDSTANRRLIELNAKYSVAEWGMLTKPNQKNEGRFLTIATIMNNARNMRVAVHLCGGYSNRIMANQYENLALPTKYIRRFQVNHTSPDPEMLYHLKNYHDKPVIGQWRKPETGPWGNKEYSSQQRSCCRYIQWLYDCSGGKGVRPDKWPNWFEQAGGWVGIAGGIDESNVFKTLYDAAPDNMQYWIDMESGVRTNDRFDLDKVQAVLAKLTTNPWWETGYLLIKPDGTLVSGEDELQELSNADRQRADANIAVELEGFLDDGPDDDDPYFEDD
jgi:hypothetical protein